MDLRSFGFHIKVLVWIGCVILVTSAGSPLWSGWEEWTNCSRQCGWGVSLQRRRCLQGACQGPEKRYRTCKIMDCPPGTPDFRAYQCALSNDEKHTDGQMYDWIPVENLAPDQRCTLTCQARGRDVTKVLSPKVLDGTTCSADSVDMCILGRCEPVGCDYQLNSTAILDRCGVCNGENNTCKLMKGNQLTQPYLAETPAVRDLFTIPSGSRSIRLTSKGPNFLGLRGEHSGTTMSQSHLPSDSGEYTIDGVVVDYSSSQKGRENAHIDGPLREPLVVYVFFRGMSTIPEKVHYQYVVPLKYGWKNVGWSDCTTTCGHGEQVKVFMCINLSTGHKVPDSNCDQSKPQFGRRPCTKATCPPEWQPDPWQPCSQSCSGGIQTRNVYCVERAPNNMLMRMDEDLCPGTKPHDRQRCNMESCPHWLTGIWSECSVTCGPGTKHREVYCVNSRRENSDGCNHATRPSLGNSCIVGIPCIMRPKETPSPQSVTPSDVPHQPLHQTSGPSFHVGDWGPCSASCGSGTMSRSVRCKVFLPSNQILQDIPEDYCSHRERPEETAECQALEGCSEPDESFTNVLPSDFIGGPLAVQFVWRYVGFTECSASCVGGLKESLVQCVHIVDETPVSDTLCDITSRPDTFTLVCNEEPCPVEWKIPLFKECSVSCGAGIQYPLQILCMRTNARGIGNTVVLPEAECAGIPVPTDPVPCNLIDCPAFWHTEDWSECSKSCEGGVRSRTLTCKQTMKTGDEITVDWSQCPSTAPLTTDSCNTGPCEETYQWRPQDWSECSVTCGVGTKVRPTTCQHLQPDGQVSLVDLKLCQRASRPSNTEFCQMNPCIKSKISTNDTTYHQDGYKNKLRLNVGMTAYVNEGVAITVRCPVQFFKKSEIQWFRGSKLISKSDVRFKVPIDGTLRIRHAGIVDEGVYTCQAGPSSAKFTLHISEPLQESRMFATETLKLRWHRGSWSPCSASCGGGVQTRSAVCQHTTRLVSRDRPNPDSVCIEQGLVAPATTRECNKHGCQAHWTASEWQECNGECVDAYTASQTRAVHCEGGSQETLADNECELDTRPSVQQACQTSLCSPAWTMSAWSKCSLTCGSSGIQTRLIHCTYSGTGMAAPTMTCAGQRQPTITRTCPDMPDCQPEDCVDKIKICSLVKKALMCEVQGYKMSCCQTCATPELLPAA